MAHEETLGEALIERARDRCTDGADLFHVWQQIVAVLLGAHHVVATVADGFVNIDLLLVFHWAGEKCSGSVESGILKLAWDAVACDLKEARGETSRANGLDDFLGFDRGRIFDEGSDVDGRHKASG